MNSKLFHMSETIAHYVPVLNKGHIARARATTLICYVIYYEELVSDKGPFMWQGIEAPQHIRVSHVVSLSNRLRESKE
jgi:hypothetical protein